MPAFDPTSDPASAVADAVEALNREIGNASRLRDVGVVEEEISRLAEVAAKDPCHATNPRTCSEADFARLFKEAW